MPSHRGFHAHAVWADCKSGKVTPTRDFMKEYHKEVSADGKRVSVYIAAEAGRFFAGTWWSNHRNPRTAPAYSAEFILEGEPVHHASFGRKAAARIQGIAGEWEDDSDSDSDGEGRRYYFMFRSMEVTGEDENSTAVPDELGQLEIIIRKREIQNEDLDMSDVSSVRTDSDSESATSGSSDDDSGSDYDPKGKKKEGKKASTANLKDTHDVFTDWQDKKPRHTHTAAMTRSDGTLWKDQPRYTLQQLISGNEDDVIVRFVFFYTSIEHIRMMMRMKTPKTRLSTSPPSDQLRRGLTSDDNTVNSQRVRRRRQHGDPAPSQVNVKVEQDATQIETRSAAKRRRVEPTLGHSLKIKTEDRQRMYNEMIAHQDQARRIKIELDADRRACGEMVKGDADDPIMVED